MSNTATINHQSSSSGILFASPDDRVFVLDIPTTIAAAQRTADCPWTKKLVSREALTAPLPSLEPKSDNARQRLLDRGQGTVDDADAQRVEIIRNALQFVKSTYNGVLVLPRSVAFKRGHDGKVNQHEAILLNALSSLVRCSQQTIVSSNSTCVYSHDLETWLPWSPHLSNPHSRTLPLHIRTSTSTSPLTFHLPPHSSFLLHILPPSTPALAPTPVTGFDIILLDPPWPNRSVKRSGHYTGPRALEDTRDLLSGLNLSAHLSDEDHATVAIWVTNSAAVNEIVCGPDGWLSELGLEAVEEWLWIKTTTDGVPIHDLSGLWRKPYEVLVIARRMSESSAPSLSRKVLIAVPDVHSRKPCLMQLFERFVVPASYQGLEIFARHLTASWHSWGNEALLFNWEGHWRE